MQLLVGFFGIKELISHDDYLSWNHVLLWLHIASDLLITVAYYSVPLMLVYFARKRKDRKDRKDLCMKLKDSQSYVQSLVDAALDGVITIDHTGKVVAWNHQASMIFGYSSEQALGRDIAELIVPLINREAHRQGIKRFIQTGTPTIIGTRIEVEGMRADGSEFPLELTISAINQYGGLFFNAYVRDISKRKQAEIALRVSEEHFQTIFRKAPLGIALVDSITGRFISANEMYARITGKTVDEILQIDWMQITHPDDIQKDLDNMALLNVGKISRFNMEKRYLRSDGTVVWVNLSIEPVMVDKENHRHLAMIEDITDRKQIEKELHIAATTFESQEAMVITDANQVILKVNQTFITTTGYSSEEAVGNTPALLKSGRQDKQFYNEMWKSLRRDKFWTGEIWNRRKNGEIYPEWLSISSVIDASGEISNYVAAFSDITTVKKSEETIHRLAFYDSLTGLPNRRLLTERLQLAMKINPRNISQSAILFIDLDNFKELNDSKGHDTGNLLLIESAKRIQPCVRSMDTVACFGGDDFVVLLNELHGESDQAALQAGNIAEKIRIALNQPLNLEDINYQASSSIGISLFNHESNIDDLFKHTDMAMYQAKQSGRNTIRFFDPSTHAAMEARIALDADLRLALPNNQFRLYYQMQIDNTGKILGAEALIRWQHPVHGLVPPSQFIPLTEENGLIISIGLWVLETACAQIKHWESAVNTQNLQLSVNVSALQFRQADFVKQVCVLLEKYAIQTDRLKLELTESLVLDNIDDTIKKMHELKKIGVHFSMDDFGTGYSSLAYLTQLPLDQLKIDQSFVRNIGIKPSDAVIVQTIIAMAKNLEMNVIAEGVETEQQRDFLEQNGCTHYQGYFFGRPVPIEQFDQRLFFSKPAA